METGTFYAIVSLAAVLGLVAICIVIAVIREKRKNKK